jgi:hypothetical protein
VRPRYRGQCKPGALFQVVQERLFLGPYILRPQGSNLFLEIAGDRHGFEQHG